jgi:hypothetical protein
MARFPNDLIGEVFGPVGTPAGWDGLYFHPLRMGSKGAVIVRSPHSTPFTENDARAGGVHAYVNIPNAAWTTAVSATVPTGRVWHIVGFGAFCTVGSYEYYVRLRIGGTVWCATRFYREVGHCTGPLLGVATAGQLVEVVVYQNSGAARYSDAWFVYLDFTA